VFEEAVPIYPRVIDCFPPLRALPGCKVVEKPEPCYFRSTYIRPHPEQLNSRKPCVSVPTSAAPSPTSSSVRGAEEDMDDMYGNFGSKDIAIPSGMRETTTQADLPTVPPPPQYWKLKQLDHSANVMDYWIKSTQQWDIEGIESDIAVSLSS
jgi:hypothetical protein